MLSTLIGAPTSESWVRFRPLTAQDRSVMAAPRSMVEPTKGKLRGSAARAPFDALMTSIIAPKEVTFREDRTGGIPGWWCEPTDALTGAAILHVHGGWFNVGSAVAYRHLMGRIARSAGTTAFIPDYRLAPEYPGIDARLDVWEGMPHGFVGGIGQTQAADSALSAIGEFPSSRLAPRSGTRLTSRVRPEVRGG
jgi:monoterpene epsilon-lactone hydrolase